MRARARAPRAPHRRRAPAASPGMSSEPPPAPAGPFDGGRPRIVALKARKGGVPSRDFLCLGDRPAGSGRHVRIALEGRGRIHSFAFSCSGAVRRRRAHASSFVEAGRVGRPRMACAARVER